jgi:hypothetical protein
MLFGAHPNKSRASRTAIRGREVLSIPGVSDDIFVSESEPNDGK